MQRITMWYLPQTIEDILLLLRQQNKQASDTPNKPRVSPAGELTNKLRQSKDAELPSRRSGGQKSTDRHLPIREA